MTASLIFALFPLARAQDGDVGGDAHGRLTAIRDGDPADPLLVWSPEAFHPGDLSAGVTLEYGDSLLIRRRQVSPDPDDIATDRLLDDTFGIDVQLQYSVADRIAVGLDAPLWLYEIVDDEARGPAPGDIRLTVPVGIVLPETDGTGGGVSVVPYLGLPTGADRRFLGDSGPSFGVIGAAGWHDGRIGVDGNVGLGTRSWDGFGDVRRAGVVDGGLALGVQPIDSLGVHAELVATKVLIDADRTGPVEAALTADWRAKSGIHLDAGVGRGLNDAIGTAAFRLWGGIGYSPPAADSGPDINPVAGGITFHVAAPDQQPVANAVITIAGKDVGITDRDGDLRVATVAWKKGVDVRAEGYLAEEVPESDAPRVDIVLDWAPVPLAVIVRDQNGVAVDNASITALGSTTVTFPAPAQGRSEAVLPEGDYTLTVDSPDYARQRRSIHMVHGRPGGTIEVLLDKPGGDGSISLDVRDPQGNAPLGAHVVLDGRPVGDVGNGGLIELDELARVEHRLEVTGDGFQTLEQSVVAAAEPPEPTDFVLDRLPGSVKVVARAPSGSVLDAQVRFDGRTSDGQTVRLAPEPLGGFGERIFVLRPGTWQVLVTSPTYGVQQRGIVVPPDETRLIVVDIVLQSDEGGDARLALRVVDIDGEPIDAAHIQLDDKDVGTTSTEGTVELSNLDVGARTLAVTADHFMGTPEEVVLVSGLQERVVTLPWKPGTVRVRARTPTGVVTDASARFAGPATVAPLTLGDDGQELTELAPGAWTVLVSSPSLGLQQRKVTISADPQVTNVDVMLVQPEGGAADLHVVVVDEQDLPVPNAMIRIDGTPFGTTSADGVLDLSALDAGQRVLDVAAEPYSTIEKRITLKDGAQNARFVLAFSAGATRVTVKDVDGNPVPDAVVRFGGPTSIKPTPLGAEGGRMFQLTPGRWQAVIVSPHYGLAQKVFTIAEGAQGITDVEVTLKPVSAGTADLMIRVVDPDGKPIDGASIEVAGTDRGKSDMGGALVVAGLDPGDAALVVDAPGFQRADLGTVHLDEGAQERIVSLIWQSKPIHVVVVDSNARPVDAEIRFDGPADMAPARVGDDGEGDYSLRPGTWQVMASTADLGMKRATVTIKLNGPQEPQVVKLTLDAKAKTDVTGTEVVLLEQVQFDFNSANLRGEAAPVLDEVAALMLAHPEIVRIEVQGHTDDIGTVEVNYDLSNRRAEAVRQALILRGVAAERLVARGYGPTRPISPNADDAARAKNRRVQFDITERADPK